MPGSYTLGAGDEVRFTGKDPFIPMEFDRHTMDNDLHPELPFSMKKFFRHGTSSDYGTHAVARLSCDLLGHPTQKTYNTPGLHPAGALELGQWLLSH